jgi:hypothetical protein
MHTIHLLPSVAIQPNLELKTQPKQLLGSLPLVITLPALGYFNIFSSLNVALWSHLFYSINGWVSGDAFEYGGWFLNRHQLTVLLA